MRRRMAMLVAVTAVSGVMMAFSPTANPAQAEIHGACLGALGQAHLHSPFTYPVTSNPPGTTTLQPPHSASFEFHFTANACVTVHNPPTSVTPTTTPLSAAGVAHGWCGLSTGSGVTSENTPFHWIDVGGDFVVTGGLSGTGHVDPNALAGDSCNTGADDFIVTGGAVWHSCTTTVPVAVSVNDVSVTGVHDDIHACV